MPDKKNVNTFSKGLAMDMAKEVSTSNTISDGYNGVILPREDDDFILQNIKGFELKGFLPENYFPTAIKVFNGIAYIVSKKYNNESKLEYTEIGTYPSPDWCALFPDKIEISDVDFTQAEDLQNITVLGVDGFSYNNSLNKIYTFAIGSFGQYIFNGFYNFFDMQLYYTEIVEEDKLFYGFYTWFRIFDAEDDSEITEEYHDNVIIDIVRLEDSSLAYTKQGSGSNKTDPDIKKTSIRTGYRLIKAGPYYALSKTYTYSGQTEEYKSYSRGGTLGLTLTKHGKFYQRTWDGFSVSAQGDEWATHIPEFDSFIGDDDQEVRHKILFIVKTDKHIKKDIYFKILFAPYNDTTHYYYGLMLNTKTGKLEDTSRSDFLGLSNYKNLWNKNIPVVGEARSRIIYASQDIELDIEESDFCGLGYKSSQDNYVGFKPMSFFDFLESDNNSLIWGKNYHSILKRYIKFPYTISGSPYDLPTDLMRIAYISNLESVNDDGNHSVYNGDKNVIASDNIYQTDDGIIICNIKNLFTDNIKGIRVDYGIMPEVEDGINFKELIHLSFRDVDYLTNDKLYYNLLPIYYSSNGYAVLDDWRIHDFYEQTLFQRNDIEWWFLNPGLFNRIDDSFRELSLPEEYGAQYFSNSINYNSEIHVAARILEYKSYLETTFNINFGSIITPVSATMLKVDNCIGVGQSSNLTVDLNHDCCNNAFNVLLHFKLDINTFSQSHGNFKILFSSLYAYLGSIFKEYTISPMNYKDDVILLFNNVPNGSLKIKLTCDVGNVLQDYMDSLILVNGYYYCLEDKKIKLEDKYRPICNFTADKNINDIYLQDSFNYNEPFRSKTLLDDTRKDAELELQPNYDGTINLIINDKSSKVKFINSRFAINPSSLECFIPQKFDYNDDNVYSEKYINFTELIRRNIKVLDVEFKELQKGGKLLGGTNIYYFRYVDSDGNTTDIAGHTLPISIYNIEGGNKILGIKAGEKTNTAVKIELSNFDRSFKQIELSYVYNAGELNNTQKFIKLNKTFNIPISNKLIITHTGLEEFSNLSDTEIGKYYNHHKSINSIAQSKNRLVLSNHKLSDISIYQEIKRLALNMIIKEELVLASSIDNENKDVFYSKSRNTHYYTGYWRGETYQEGIQLDLIMGGVSPVFNPRGIDNYNGVATYSNNTSINEFTGQFGENPYGIYRTNSESPIMTGDSSSGHDTYIVALKIEGLKDFLEHPLVKSISKGYSIVRKDRIKDTLMQGYIVPVIKVPFGVGMIPEPAPEVAFHQHQDGYGQNIKVLDDFENTQPSVYFDINQPVIQELNLEGDPDDQSQYKYHIAPFGLMQIYSGLEPYSTNHNYLHGYVSGDMNNKVNIVIQNVLVKQDAYIQDKFGFVSGDILADVEHIASSFKGEGKYYDVSRQITKFSNEGGKIGSPINPNSDINKKITYLDSDVNNTFKKISNETESYYIPELTDCSTPEFFSSKLDQTNMNIQSLGFIGVTESKNTISDIFTTFVPEKYENPYGFLTNIYTRAEGALSNKDWSKFYSSRYNEGGYFPVTISLDINKSLNNILWNDDINNLKVYGGDCYINKTYIRIFNKIGLKDNFDSYSNIWDYVGKPGSVDYMNKPFNEDDIASNSWFEDNSYMALKRARLIPKGMWVEVAHESNFNLALRSEEFKSPEEMGVYNKNRTHLISKDKIASYISSEFNSSQLETKAYNKGYSFNSGVIYNYTFKDLEKLLRVFYTRVEVSDIAVRGELKNGYRELYGLNYRDYDTKYGYITKVITSKDITFVIFEKGVAVIPLAEKQMISEANGGVYIAMDQILGERLTQISESYGSIHPNSCITTETGVYFFDHNNLAIIHVAQQARDISSHKIEKFLFGFKNKLKEIRDEFPDKYFEYNVRTNYNILNGNITFTFYIIEKENLVSDNCSFQNNESYNDTEDSTETSQNNESENSMTFIDDVSTGTTYNPINICEEVDQDFVPQNTVDDNKIVYSTSIYYNERLQYWINRLTYDTNFEFSVGDNTFSTNLIYNENRLYIEDSNNVNYCFFYDKQHDFSFEFIINQGQMVQTIINNLQVVSNHIIPITLSINVDTKKEMSNLEEYNLDLEQNIKVRRAEIKIISLEVGGVHNFFLNINDALLHTITPGYTFTINGTDYRVHSITDTVTDNGIIMPMLELEYLNSGIWENLNTIIGEEKYNQVYGEKLLISIINIARANSDYIEDHLYIEVQKVKGRRVRDKVFKVRMDYDGIDHTYIQAIISSVEMSFS